jgi:hypothetical protein
MDPLEEDAKVTVIRRIREYVFSVNCFTRAIAFLK